MKRGSVREDTSLGLIKERASRLMCNRVETLVSPTQVVSFTVDHTMRGNARKRKG